MSFFRKIKSKYKVTAGPGAGVTVRINCDVDFKKNKRHTIVFKPAKADVEFSSYYDTRSSSEYEKKSGLEIKLEPLSGDELNYFEHRYNSEGSFSITEKNKLYEDEKDRFRELVLSGGYIRSKVKTGDRFSFKVELDPDYNIFLHGEAIFLDHGVDAWNDLDSGNEDDDNDE